MLKMATDRAVRKMGETESREVGINHGLDVGIEVTKYKIDRSANVKNGKENAEIVCVITSIGTQILVKQNRCLV